MTDVYVLNNVAIPFPEVFIAVPDLWEPLDYFRSYNKYAGSQMPFPSYLREMCVEAAARQPRDQHRTASEIERRWHRHFGTAEVVRVTGTGCVETAMVADLEAAITRGWA